MDVLVNRFFVWIYFFTEWVPKCTTYKLKFKSNRFFHETKMRTLAGACVFMYLLDFTNIAKTVFIYLYMK